MRTIFMLINKGLDFQLKDYIEVFYHGLSLDAAVSAYIITIPFFVTFLSLFFSFAIRPVLVIYTIAISLLIATIFIADLILYPFWGFKLDTTFMIYIDSPTNALASVSVGYSILCFVLLAVTALIIAVLLIKQIPQNRYTDNPKKTFSGIAYILLGAIIFLAIRGGVGESTNNIGQVYYSDNLFLNHSAVNPAFSLIYSMGKSHDFSKEYSFFDNEELKKRTKDLYPIDSTINDILLQNNRPNIITIIFEGLSGIFIQELGGEANVTPNFARHSEDGVLFTRCYGNSFRTDRGLISTLSGYPSFPRFSVMKSPIKSQTLPSLASALGQAGYINTFIYGGDINFTSLNSYLFSSGYSKVISDKDFTTAQRSTHAWGVGDEITFDTLYNIAISQPKEPWQITYLTLSSHEPWNVPYNRIGDNKIANSFAYTDSCFGHFIDKIKETGLWENLLIVCISDHSVVTNPGTSNENDINRNNIPLLLLGGALKESKRIDIICNQSDMPSTILAQMNLPIEKFTFSRNILSNSYIYPFAYHTFNNGFSLIDSTGLSVYDLNQSNAASESLNKEMKGIEIGKSILQKSYLDYRNR